MEETVIKQSLLECIAVFTLPPMRGAKYCNEYVCLFIGLSVSVCQL